MNPSILQGEPRCSQATMHVLDFAAKLFGLLLAGTGLGYFIARVRGVW